MFNRGAKSSSKGSSSLDQSLLDAKPQQPHARPNDLPNVLLRTPLQWRGYTWRKIGWGDSSSQQGSKHTVLPTTAVDAKRGDDKPKKLPKARKRSCCLYTSVSLCCALSVLVMIFVGTSIFANANSTDPCVKAYISKAFMDSSARKNPELKNKLEFPKIIHQQWKTDKIPEGRFTKWHQAWLDLYPEPEYTHVLWTDDSARELIETHYPWFLETYDGYEFGIQRADAVRYFILHFHGGLYADLDYEPLVNFWDHLPKDRVSLIESPYQYNEMYQNALMASPRGDPFWTTAFKVLIELKDEPVLKATGPVFVDIMLSKQPEEFHSLACENFQRIPFTQKEGEKSPFMTRLHRDILGRLYPMKYCGDFTKSECQFGKHHNTASYLPETGVINLLWT